jgi:hypothetical protein
MTPKEKAEELVDRYMNIRNVKLSDYSIIYLPTAKQCALIAADEIINTGPLKMIDWGEIISDKPYWEDVKQEIEAL